jgi:cytochrome b pre-mRNA-processing protein 3
MALAVSACQPHRAGNQVWPQTDMLNWIRERKHRREHAAKLLDVIIAQARQPVFYAEYGVPDTMLGRYEMVCLHAYLVLHRLKRLGGQGPWIAQTLHDQIFDNFEIALREVGVGDMGIGKRIKKLARNLHGRISAYERALASGDADMAAALRRNLYASAEPTEPEVTAMIAYIRSARAAVEACASEDFWNGRPLFPAPVDAGRAREGAA